MKRAEYRSGRRIAVMYFLTRFYRAQKRGDSVLRDKLGEVLEAIQASCPHSEAGRFQAKVSGTKIRAGQWFTMCIECNKLLGYEDAPKDRPSGVQVIQGP